MSKFQSQPVKIYIQDIFRAKRTEENKYIYELFDFTFKNIMIHGVVTSIYNNKENTTNLEVSDPTGTVQVYYDASKNNSSLDEVMRRNLNRHFTAATKFGDDNIGIMAKLMELTTKNKFNFSEGDFVTVVGDIFVDDKVCRMIAAYECSVSSIERDVVWLEELSYLYEKYYLKNC